jgi:putative membrane protein
MKRLSFLFTVLIAAWTFQSCGDTNNDSVDNAIEANEQKTDDNTEVGDSATGDANATTGTTTPLDDADSKRVVEVASGGMMEVVLGELAQQKAQDPRVKNFGQMMVTDHTKANEELKAMASRKNVTLPQTPGEDHRKHIDDLRNKTGRDFDKAYMSMMVDDHQEDINKFEKLANDATDADLKAFASKTLPVLRAHLDSAKAINDAVKRD